LGIRHFFYRSRRTLILIIIVVAVTLMSSTLIAIWLSRSYGVFVSNIGTIYVTGVEAYGGDIKSINGTSYIDWGTLQWGDSKNVSFYLRSTSSVQTKLAFNATDWTPEGINNYVAISWNYNGTRLAPEEEILVTFTLTAPSTRDFANYLISNNLNSYNFTLYIYAIN
jgi:hypothetical protein